MQKAAPALQKVKQLKRQGCQPERERNDRRGVQYKDYRRCFRLCERFLRLKNIVEIGGIHQIFHVRL